MKPQSRLSSTLRWVAFAQLALDFLLVPVAVLGELCAAPRRLDLSSLSRFPVRGPCHRSPHGGNHAAQGKLCRRFRRLRVSLISSFQHETTQAEFRAPHSVKWRYFLKNSRSCFGLLGFGAAVAAAGYIGARYSPRDLRTKLWYKRLDKPSWNPPEYVFPIVWTALYSLIAVSGWRTWQQPSSPDVTRAPPLGDTAGHQCRMDAPLLRPSIGRSSPCWMSFLWRPRSSATSHQRRTWISARQPVSSPMPAWVAFATVLNAEIVRRNP